MYFLGTQNIRMLQFTISIYDIAVAGIGLLLFWFFISTAVREAHRLALLGK
jgi:hypothetical protein